eukprot:NODE_5281_length_962_cov_65.702026_g5066_i0.p1 GENE.NODE_5281_length_962_cov_65.702026_g5066_i0~~NODE_5281_length_962_cov_65.702026_g5066_i0.p1  ORF type:complete len:274 (-),score=54.20 NODE_5281_length_962_cov_65.702026_g5066_i0:141-908(-)
MDHGDAATALHSYSRDSAAQCLQPDSLTFGPSPRLTRGKKAVRLAEPPRKASCDAKSFNSSNDIHKTNRRTMDAIIQKWEKSKMLGEEQLHGFHHKRKIRKKWCREGQGEMDKLWPNFVTMRAPRTTVGYAPQLHTRDRTRPVMLPAENFPKFKPDIRPPRRVPQPDRKFARAAQLEQQMQQREKQESQKDSVACLAPIMVPSLVPRPPPREPNPITLEDLPNENFDLESDVREALTGGNLREKIKMIAGKYSIV